MRTGSLAVRTCHMDGLELLVGMVKMFIQRQGVVKSLLIAAGTLPLKHRRGIEQVFTRLLVSHVDLRFTDLRFTDLRKVILKLLEDGIAGLLVPLEVITGSERLDGLLFFTRECPWHIDADVHYEVTLATAIALYGRQTFATQTKGLARLGSILQLHPQL